MALLVAAGLAPRAERAIVCHNLLITPRVTALAWTRNNRLAPVKARFGRPVYSLLNDDDDVTWDPVRVSVVVPLKMRADVDETVLGPHAGWLPAGLEKVLRGNIRFETAAESTDGPYSLWMLVPPGGKRGRTGILLYNRRPIVIVNPQTRAEYLVELKGAGLPSGGYVQSEEFQALQGGLWDQEARLEYHRLGLAEPLHGGEGVMGLGFQSFNGPHGRQEILFRLTPGNLRASYRGDYQLDSLRRFIMTRKMGHRLGELLTIGYGAITHGENFVVDKNRLRVFLTDFLDVLPLADGANLRGFDEPNITGFVRFTLEKAQRYHGFIDEREIIFFHHGVTEVLLQHGFKDVRALALTWGPEDGSRRIMNGGLASRILGERAAYLNDPDEDPELAKALETPCGQIEINEKFWRIVEWAKERFADEDAPSFALLRRATADLEAYGHNQITQDQLLENADVLALLNSLKRLRLRDRHIPRSALSPTRYLLTQEWSTDPARIFKAAFPGLLALKIQIQSEYDLIVSALVTKPDSPELLRTLTYLKKLIGFYRTTPLVSFRKLICEDRATFRRLFYMPHHAGFDPSFLDGLAQRLPVPGRE